MINGKMTSELRDSDHDQDGGNGRQDEAATFSPIWMYQF